VAETALAFVPFGKALSSIKSAKSVAKAGGKMALVLGKSEGSVSWGTFMKTNAKNYVKDLYLPGIVKHKTDFTTMTTEIVVKDTTSLVKEGVKNGKNFYGLVRNNYEDKDTTSSGVKTMMNIAGSTWMKASSEGYSKLYDGPKKIIEFFRGK
ncbi:hypothetical protein, partial [Alloscardovia theropitheci]